jgi:hypothetical protein
MELKLKAALLTLLVMAGGGALGGLLYIYGSLIPSWVPLAIFGGGMFSLMSGLIYLAILSDLRRGKGK